MKKLLLLLVICVGCNFANAQEKSGIYYDSNKVEYSRVIGKKVENLAGAYFTLGLSSAKSSLKIEGKTAEMKIEERQPSFDVYIGDDALTEYIFENSANLDNMVIVSIHTKKKSRSIRTGKYGLTGVSVGLDEEDVQPIRIEKVTENHYRILLRERLKKGEYAFYYTGEVPEGKNQFNGVFDFKIE